LPLADILSNPPRALREQAHTPRELPPGMIGSDGYGFAWYAPGSPEPARYRQVLPIWGDDNLDGMAPHIRSACLVASSRTATRHMPVATCNTPPFLAGTVVLVHNGSIGSFNRKISLKLRSKLRPETEAKLCGNTDSEHLAALLADAKGSSLAARVVSMLGAIEELVRGAGETAQLNLIVADGENLVAVRHALGEEAPTLFVAERPGRGVLVASEPLDDDEPWTRLAVDSLVVAHLGSPMRIRPLHVP
jgi:glutamine amidotransferase